MDVRGVRLHATQNSLRKLWLMSALDFPQSMSAVGLLTSLSIKSAGLVSQSFRESLTAEAPEAKSFVSHNGSHLMSRPFSGCASTITFPGSFPSAASCVLPYTCCACRVAALMPRTACSAALRRPGTASPPALLTLRNSSLSSSCLTPGQRTQLCLPGNSA